MMKPAGPAFECIILCVADGRIVVLEAVHNITLY